MLGIVGFSFITIQSQLIFTKLKKEIKQLQFDKMDIHITMETV